MDQRSYDRNLENLKSLCADFLTAIGWSTEDAFNFKIEINNLLDEIYKNELYKNR